MKKRLLSLLLALALCLGFVVPVIAVSDAANAAADVLYELGLFKGTGTNPDGTPNYDLDRAPNRMEAVTLLVRLLGKEAEAAAKSWITPFSDVANWAKPYVGYAYANGLTKGTSITTFGGNETVSATQYLTFVLRALGYTSGVDFEWDRAWELTDALGITHGEYGENSSFTRGDAVIVSVNALNVMLKDGSKTLLDAIKENLAASVDGTRKVVYANTADEVRAAIASNTEIRLSGTTYNFGDMELIISNVENLWLIGTEGTEFVTTNNEDTVVSVYRSSDIKLSGITMGHEVPKELVCFAGVLYVNQVTNLYVVNCDLYGCGVEGFDLTRSTVSFENSIIRDCTERIGSVYASSVTFNGCTFSNNGYNISGYYSDDVAFGIAEYSNGIMPALVFTDCIFSGNKNVRFKAEYDVNGNKKLVKADYNSGYTKMTNCTYTDNRWQI